MNSRRDFVKIAADARRDGFLPVLSSEDKSRLKGWVGQNLGIQDARELEYVVERVALENASEDEVLAYLKALGEPYVSGDKEKTDALSEFLKEIEKAGASSHSEPCDQLHSLLKRLNGDEIREPTGKSSFVELPESGTLYVVGDLHGDAHAAKLLCNFLKEEVERPSDNKDKGATRVVFLGDYVNNGLMSIETLIEVLQFQETYKDNVILLSGNHEFAETLATAFKEFFETHWGQWVRFSKRISPGFKTPPRHYGHIHTDLLRIGGVRRGRDIYREFAQWGRSLPYLVLSKKGVLICHSVGLRGSGTPLPSKQVVMDAKSDPADIEELENVGYEAWKKRSKTVHAQMVNNRMIKRCTLDHLVDLFGNDVFVVGHTHYRSGDRDSLNGYVLTGARRTYGMLATLCSSHPRSPDAGHYIAYEMEFSRRDEARLYGRAGVAYPCVARFTADKVPLITEENILWFQDVI